MKRVATVSALAIAAMAGPVAADVTPDQVWSDLKTYMESFGYAMNATETVSGDTLTVSDLAMTVLIPEEGATVTIAIPDLTYSGNGDGTVSMTMPDDGRMVVSFGDTGAAPDGIITMALQQSGFLTVISGAPDAMVYDYEAESLSMSIVEVIAEGETLPEDVMTAAIGMGPLAGRSEVTRSDGLQTIVQALSYGDLTYDVAFEDPEGSGTFVFAGSMRGFEGSGSTSVPLNADFEDPMALFQNGFAVDAVISHRGGDTAFDFDDAGERVAGTFSSEGGELAVAMSGASMTYALSALAQTVNMTVPDMPFPIQAAIGEMGFSIDVPLEPSDTPQPASLSLLFADFTMADMLWNIFDPGQTLPRDPATIGATPNAEITPFVSVLDEDAMMTMGATGGVPGELNAAELSGLVISAAGGEITGNGSFVFDNTDLETFDGLPRPIGQINLRVSGANGLIDNLISMGLLAEEDAMGARMMLSMFTVPGDAPDSATSTIEINEQGHILANGQRIQ